MKNVLLIFAFILVFGSYGCQQQDTQQTEETATEETTETTTEPQEQPSEAPEPAKEQGKAEEPSTETTKEQAKPAEEAASGQKTGQEHAKAESTAAGTDKPVDGAEIFQKNRCGTCHQPATESAGPSLQKIAQDYKEKNGDLVAFLKGEAEPIVDPSKADMMKPLLMPLKSLSEEEYKALADYILEAK